jgi:hypothetical protein
MAGEVVQIISISVVEATMVIPYRNRGGGVQGFRRPELGAILIQQQAARTAAMETLLSRLLSMVTVCKGVRRRWDGKWAWTRRCRECAIGVAVRAGIVVEIR